MGKPTMQENDRRGMAAIRDLHASALSSSRIQRQLRGLGTEDTRLRTVLADIDTSDPVVVDAWAMLVKAVLIGRSNRRGSTWRGYTSNTTGDSSLRQQYIEHGFNDDPRHRLRIPSVNRRHGVRSRLGPGPGASGNSGERSDRPASPRFEGPTAEWDFLTASSPYEILPLGQQREDGTAGSRDLFNWLRDPSSYEEPAAGTSLGEAIAVVGIGPPSEPPLNLVRASPPPAIDFGSPSFATTSLPRILRSPTPPRPRGGSHSPSLTPATRAWITEFEANRNASNSEGSRSLFALGRRRRDDDSGSMRRTRRADGSRDTRRDAIIIQTGPGEEGWYDGMVEREREWRRSHGLIFGVGDDPTPAGEREGHTVTGTEPVTEAAAGEGTGDGNTDAPGDPTGSASEDIAGHSHGLARTMSLSAVGGGERPLAPLPRRRASLYHGEWA